ncbi:MAG: hypothetical protein V2A73_21045 [Pseudomonadota bacterium]
MVTTRYEEIRRQVMEQHTFGCRLGLAVLLHSGVAAWIDAWRSCTTLSTSPPQPPQADASDLSNEVDAEVVHVLANIALNNLEKEMRA